jgi:hypothetical protein
VPELGQLAVGLLVTGALLAALSVALLVTLAKPGTQSLRVGHVVLRNLDRYVEKRHHFLVKGVAAAGATLFAAGAVLMVVGAVGK